MGQGYNFISENEAMDRLRKHPHYPLFTNSENSIAWVERNLPFMDTTEKVRLFKDKVRFRELLRSIYPEYFFKSVAFTDLEKVNVEALPFPFVIKPAVGFFSMGVYNVDKKEEWPVILKSIQEEMEIVKDLFPLEVMDGTTFIIEQHIPGEEFAVDCYFSDKGEPVILNIMHHLFSSGKDVSDRVYITSKEIIRRYKPVFEDFLKKLGSLAGLKNFLIHIEIRMDQNGQIIPIEVNPMRFGGWCTTADLTWHAHGFNSYEYFNEGKRPDWDQVFSSQPDDLFSVIVLDNGSGVKGEEIDAFDYERLTSGFKKPLVVRAIDYKAFPLFGFVFAQTSQEDMSELDNILHSDLREFIQVKQGHIS
ncbi:MAG: ATP-grasp domain-containing protein [Bacteroidetes bacterium]|nr:MAG: ATP-grasp domain-containing protein [Bacteroidota bacterium]